LLYCNYRLEVWNDTTKRTEISITIYRVKTEFPPPSHTARPDSAKRQRTRLAERRPSKRQTASGHARVCRAPAADWPGRGRARAEKPPPRPGGFGFQRARRGNVARSMMTIPVYGGNQGNGIGHAAAVHTRNSHSARTHMCDTTLMSVYKRTHAHTCAQPPPSWNIIIIVIILDDDDDDDEEKMIINNNKISNSDPHTEQIVVVVVRKRAYNYSDLSRAPLPLTSETCLALAQCPRLV